MIRIMINILILIMAMMIIRNNYSNDNLNTNNYTKLNGTCEPGGAKRRRPEALTGGTHHDQHVWN